MDFYDKFIQTHLPKKVDSDNISREYLVGGKGEKAFLIFPGSGQDALSCYDLIDAFETEYKTIAINYDRIYSLNEFFNYVEAILDQENITEVILYGLSLGGFLAQHFVRRNKDITKVMILSHSGSTRSKTIREKVAKPGKALYKIIPIIPQFVFNYFFKPIAGRIQAGQSNIIGLYEKYSTKENFERRSIFSQRTTFSFIDKTYLKTVYSLGTEMERVEESFKKEDLDDWHGRILIIRTENDPLAQDDGVFKKLYPEAEVYTFEETGHLTPFIQFEKMVKVIRNFLF